MIGMNGGGIFLLICFIFIIIIAIPLCWAELSLGRYTKTSAIVGMRNLEKAGSPWVLIGWMGAATVTILISIYAGTKFWEKYLAHAAQGANYFTIPRFLKFWYIIVLPLVTALVVVVGIAGYF